jgi:hypothetical protein
MNKIGFIIGCLIGSMLGGVTALGSPIGYDEFIQVENAEEYLINRHIEVPYEVKYSCEEYGLKYGICPEILEAIAWRESRFIPDVSNGSCKGLMQINEKAHRKRMEMLGVKDIYSIDGNIAVAADYLKTLMDMNGDLIKSLNEYNGRKTSKLTSYSKDIIEIASALDQGGE